MKSSKRLHKRDKKSRQKVCKKSWAVMNGYATVMNWTKTVLVYKFTAAVLKVANAHWAVNIENLSWSNPFP